MEGINYDDDSGKLTYDIYPEQREALEAFISGEYDITEFRGGNRVGKTVIGARALIYAAYMFEDTEYVAIAYSTEQGRRATWASIFENLPECDKDTPEDSPIIEYYNSTSKKLKFNNGSIIWMSTAGAGDEALVGAELNGVWCDESDYMPHIYELIDESLKRQSSNPAYGVISTSTPDPNQNKHNSDYYSIVEKREQPVTGDDLNYNIRTVTASLMDNPFVSDEKKKDYKRRHSHNATTVLHGGFSDGQGNLVYEDFNRNQNVLEKGDSVEYKDGVHMYGYDAGYRHARVILHARVTVKNQIVIVDEFYEHESTVTDAIDWLQHKPSGIMYSEHSPSDMEQFRRDLDGFKIKRANKNIDAGIDSVRGRVRADESGRVGLLFTQDCTNTIREIQIYDEDSIGSAEGGDDAMDALRYIVHTGGSRYRGSNNGSSKKVGYR